MDKLVGIQQGWAKRNPPESKMRGESAKKYSGVVLVVTVFVRSEGRRGKIKWPAQDGIPKTRRKTWWKSEE